MSDRCYYILKIKGKAKIPDYIQIRDSNFTLIGYFRPDRNEKLKKTFQNEEDSAKVSEIISTLPYGKIQKIEL